MIDKDMTNYLKNIPHPWNEKITRGLASVDLKRLPDEIDLACHSIFRNMGELEYVGYRPCNAWEQFNEITRSRGNKNLYEQSHTTARMYRYEFKFRGEKMRPRYMFITYPKAMGCIEIRDSEYVVSPTVADQLFSIEDGHVFIPITRSPTTVFREPYHFIANNQPEFADTYWSRLHYVSKEDVPRARVPQLLHYLFCHMGATESFRALGMDVTILNSDDDHLNDYPETDYVHCRSSSIKPKAFGAGAFIPKNLTVVVNKKDWNRINISIIASFFYIVDNCADIAALDVQTMDDCMMWRRALCRFIWRKYDLREAVGYVQTHLESLEEYIDDVFLRLLQRAKDPVDLSLHPARVSIRKTRTIWDLIIYVMLGFSEMTIHTNPSSVRGKRLDVLGPMAHPYIVMLTNLMYTLQKLRNKGWRKDTVEDAFNKGFKQNIASGFASGYPFISLVESATASAIIKTTGLIYRPSRNTGSASASDMYNPLYFITGDSLPLFSRRMVTKSSPTASNRVNPTIQLGPNNEVIFDPEIEKYLVEMDELRK